MKTKKNIYLGWAHIPGDVNFGDELSAYIVKHVTQKDIVHIPVLFGRIQILKLVLKRLFLLRWDEALSLGAIFFGKKYLLAIGSILQFYKFGGAVVWGSGLIEREAEVGANTYSAVRGPLTREILVNKGFSVPEVYGDPAILLKSIYNNKVAVSNQICIIPHIVHKKYADDLFGENDSFLLIDLATDNVESVIDDIRSCRSVLSSSLHGLIVAHTYGIPALWVTVPNIGLLGDTTKFHDYFLSVGIEPYEPIVLDGSLNICIINSLFCKMKINSLPSNDLDEMAKNLLNSFPLKNFG